MPAKRLSRPEQERRIDRILAALEAAYPEARCALDHADAFQLLVATILSAQCTDERVNVVTRTLFRKYRGPADYLAVPPEELERDIRTTGFFRNKARNIRGACRMIVEEYGGQVPETMENLIRLPGVARKTANVVLGVAFGKAEGIVVDTHVFRIARRLELAAGRSPEKAELDLMKAVPRKEWIGFSHRVILHGRRTCRARKPLCPGCPVEDVCRAREKMPVPAAAKTASAHRRGAPR